MQATESVSREMDESEQRVAVGEIHIKEGFNHRRHFDEAALQSLAQSIQKQGVLQSLLVRPRDDGGYWLVAGERRLRAARLAEAESVPVIVRMMSESEALAASLAENGDREGVSVGEEAKAAQRAVHLCDGDKAAASSLLGWTVKKLEGRLLLLNASDAVIDALAARKIHFGHAELLSQLETGVQDKLLPRVLESGATVEILKQQMTAFTRDLSAAIFDTADCNGCPNNSATQAELFEYHVGAGRCAHHACWQGKTDEAIKRKKAALEKEVPVVWLDRECPSGQRTALVKRGKQGVGSEQFESGCKGCAKFGAVLKTGPENAGQVERDVCFDLACNAEKVKAHADSLEAVSGGGSEPAGASTAGTGSAGTKKQPAKKAASSVGAPKKVAAVIHDELRKVSVDAAVNDAHVRLCFEVMALEAMAGNGGDATKPAKGMKALLALDEAALVERKSQAISKTLSSKKGWGHGGNVDPWTALAGVVVDHLQVDLSGRFSSNGALLEAQTKSGMESVLADCEFWRSMDGSTDEDKRKAMKKLLGGKRDEVFKAVQASKHDFSPYVPSVVRSELESIKKVSE